MFNGKGIYEIFSNKKEFYFGKQPDKIDGSETVSTGGFHCYCRKYNIRYFLGYRQRDLNFS